MNQSGILGEQNCCGCNLGQASCAGSHDKLTHSPTFEVLCGTCTVLNPSFSPPWLLTYQRLLELTGSIDLVLCNEGSFENELQRYTKTTFASRPYRTLPITNSRRPQPRCLPHPPISSLASRIPSLGSSLASRRPRRGSTERRRRRAVHRSRRWRPCDGTFGTQRTRKITTANGFLMF